VIKKILIVGGGPAGLMTALCLSQHSVEITVIEKQSWPLDKVCGEGIMPKGYDLLRKYGVSKQIQALSSRPFTGITYIDSSVAEGHFFSGPGYVVRRTELSRALYESLKGKTNVTLIPTTELVSLYQDPTSVQVTLRALSNQHIICEHRYDLIIGCDGINSKVRKLADLEGPNLRKQNRIGARVHYQIAPWTTQVEVYWKDGIECYVAPVASDCVEFVFGWNQDKIKIKQGRCPELEKKLFSYFPELESKILGHHRLSKIEARGGFARSAKFPISGRVLLIGDANVFLDPITGEGLSMAFEQAHILSQSFANIMSKEGQRSFIDQIQSLKARYINMTNLALFLCEHPLIRRIAIRFLATFPLIFQHILELNMGTRSLCDIYRSQKGISFFKTEFFEVK
jgi:2-polyprenyl-6-methoxyphenol hydroxylase-like FAD-dependent oxidoreductase